MTETSSGTPGLAEEATKECNKCHEVKPLTDYYSRKGTKDGRYGVCKSCAKAVQDAKRKADPEKHKQDLSDWYQRNKEYAKDKARQWHANNRDQRAAYVRANSEKSAARASERRALYKHGVDKMPEEERLAVQELYWLAKDLKAVSGQDYHVDHTIPLAKGGEHRLHNLQVLPADMNLAKSDKL